MKLIQRSFALICLVLLFIFCVSNGDTISVRFLAWESLELPIFLLLIFAFLTGVVLTLFGQSLRSVTKSTGKNIKNTQKAERKQKDDTLSVNTTTDIIVDRSKLSGSAAENEGDK
jgi:uncharacterized integral membrane protein